MSEYPFKIKGLPESITKIWVNESAVPPNIINKTPRREIFFFKKKYSLKKLNKYIERKHKVNVNHKHKYKYGFE